MTEVCEGFADFRSSEDGYCTNHWKKARVVKDSPQKTEGTPRNGESERINYKIRFKSVRVL